MTIGAMDIYLLVIIVSTLVVGFFWGAARSVMLLAAWLFAFVAGAYLQLQLGSYLASAVAELRGLLQRDGRLRHHLRRPAPGGPVRHRGRHAAATSASCASSPSMTSSARPSPRSWPSSGIAGVIDRARDLLRTGSDRRRRGRTGVDGRPLQGAPGLATSAASSPSSSCPSWARCWDRSCRRTFERSWLDPRPRTPRTNPPPSGSSTSGAGSSSGSTAPSCDGTGRGGALGATAGHPRRARRAMPGAASRASSRPRPTPARGLGPAMRAPGARRATASCSGRRARLRLPGRTGCITASTSSVGPMGSASRCSSGPSSRWRASS